jgi:chemotaxis response regulator CheB
MLILIVSANPLLREIISEIIPHGQSEIMELNFEEAPNRICEFRPDVIIVDETIAPPYFESVLAEARNLQKARTIVINPIKNEIILLDTRRTTLKEVDDLMEAISSYKIDAFTEIKDRDHLKDSFDHPEA